MRGLVSRYLSMCSHLRDDRVLSNRTIEIDCLECYCSCDTNDSTIQTISINLYYDNIIMSVSHYE